MGERTALLPSSIVLPKKTIEAVGVVVVVVQYLPFKEEWVIKRQLSSVLGSQP